MNNHQVVDHNTYRVSLAHEDGEYPATRVEFPSLSWLDESRVAALDGIVTKVTDVVDDLTKSQSNCSGPHLARVHFI